MNAPEKLTPPVPSASEYILDNFKPTDRIAVLVLNRQLGETTQRITTAQKAASPEFQAWLRYKNANGADIYVGMNALQRHAATRTKDDIDKISHVYLDLDHGGTASLETLENSDLIPRPNYILNTSPEKFQVVWKVEGMTIEEAEALKSGDGQGIRRRSCRNGFYTRIAPSWICQQEVRSRFLCAGPHRIKADLSPPRFQAQVRLAGCAQAPQRGS
jgi:RepB DNA-primase from phage plasmid